MSYSPVKPCEQCGREYNHVALNSCPECNVTEGSGKFSGHKPSPEEQGNILLEKIQQGVDRTTFAVRAVVSLTAILIVTSGAVFVLQLLARLAQSSDLETLVGFLNIISVAVALVGIFIAYSQFFREWRMSKVPDRN
jgi:hypothetical protein